MTTLNGKEVKLIEYFNEHWYKIETEAGPDYFPSYTTKLSIVDKPFLSRWRGDIGNREADYIMEQAGEKGSKIHSAWLAMTTGGAVIYQNRKKPNFTHEEIEELMDEYAGNISIVQNQDEQVDVFKLALWDEALKPEYLYSENIVYSLTNKEAGTVDKIIRVSDGDYMINGSKPLRLKAGVYIVDLKTGKAISDEHYMQIAGYRAAVLEMGLFKPEEIMGGIILHTGAKTRSGIEGLATLLRTNEELDQDYSDYRDAAYLWERKNKDNKPTVFEFPSIITLRKETHDVVITG